jgi:LuxR family quorum sensing-dependent transcriptional regulator
MGVSRVGSRSKRDQIFDTIDDISRLNTIQALTETLAGAVNEFGFSTLGINGLPPPGEGADPRIVTEYTPEGFRDHYIYERFYLVDHISAQARIAYRPFRYSEAPYERTDSRSHQRFMQALDTFGMGKGIIVPVGRPATVPACVWLAGKDPNLDEDAIQAVELIALFAASKARALSCPMEVGPRTSKLTLREREVLQWISAGKTSWEIGAISGLSERAINKIIAEAMIKLDAVTRTQAVVTAIRIGEIEL